MTRPSGKKVRLRDMMDPEHRQKLAEGKIGVVQGEASGGIGSIDIGDDQGAEEFLIPKPAPKDHANARKASAAARGSGVMAWIGDQIVALGLSGVFSRARDCANMPTWMCRTCAGRWPTVIPKKHPD